MIELIQYKAEHAIEVIASRSQEPGLKITGLMKEWAKQKESITSKTVVFGKKIIGCGGIEICWPGMAEAWAVSICNLKDFHVSPKIVKRQLQFWIKEHNLTRVQAPMRVDFPVGIRFAEFLGFKDENARLKKYHFDKTDALMYAITGD